MLVNHVYSQLATPNTPRGEAFEAVGVEEPAFPCHSQGHAAEVWVRHAMPDGEPWRES